MPFGVSLNSTGRIFIKKFRTDGLKIWRASLALARVIGNNMARSLFDTFLKDTLSRTMQAMQPIQSNGC
jgi:hypothetical protein